MGPVQDFPGTIVLLDKTQQTNLRKLFFPSLILLGCLNEICPRGPSRKASDAPPNPNQSPEEMFQTLVNKLAQICDFEPKGNTVTALAVIRDNGRICYVFASNRRTKVPLKNCREGLSAVLNILKVNIEANMCDSDEVMENRLLNEILFWNNVRVRAYLTSLSKELQTCIKRCNTSDLEGRSAGEALQRLASLLPDVTSGQKSDKSANELRRNNKDIGSMIQCIKAIQESKRSPLQRYIEARAVEDDNMAKGGCWATLQHSAGRLLSYQYAAQTLVHAHHIWADTELFRDFEVQSVRSSGPYPAEALKLLPESAEAIINRAPGYTPAETSTHKQHAADLQRYDLNAKLEEKWSHKLDPVVHAEMLLHDWLARTEGGTQPYRFFNNWQYIGTSKPTCRLCQEYFNIIATPVRVRAGHPNTYTNWRLPDMWVDRKNNSPASAELERKSWCEIQGKMKGRVYADLVRVLEEKVSDKKPNDSNTYTERITGIGGGVNQLANWLAGVQLR
ncbi:hypothetical protein B0T26DRAFT_775810 [Lasiosphaeria miniovina]|uniref:Uncharacterized protein n=1 Tax=Lasiosphaeria miniovina TaxID=1954250 RepID=A0AA40DV11_9PEZI|nr:uncharacterized protein B0T26DRAFT_775810 [Lasiosphaeria miniovina]KAK0717439.1 hypothetical protein B0T26DRAFT_775810 [Lasiosphaeria miniovina]